jgi:hypothetical protein
LINNPSLMQRVEVRSGDGLPAWDENGDLVAFAVWAFREDGVIV